MNNINYSSIFTIPIDGEEDDKEFSLHNNNNIIKNISDNLNQNNINNIKNSSNNFIVQNNSNKYLNKLDHIDKQQINANKWIIFSSLNTQKSTSSMATSNKVYMCEFLKHNWKLKAKRLLVKLKKKYSKKIINEDSNFTDEKIMSQCSDSKSESDGNYR